MRMHGRMRMRIYRQTYMRTYHYTNSIYEPNGIFPSYFNQKENSKFKRCSTLEIHRLLVELRHIIRRYSVRISKLCMGGSLYCIFVFLREFTSHMPYIPITFCTKQIQESCYEICFQVSIFLFSWRYVMHLTVKIR